MSSYTEKPYWIDELDRKHEFFGYDRESCEERCIELEGRYFRLIVPIYAPPMVPRLVSSSGEFLFLIAEQLEEEDINGHILEGGNGLMIAAKRVPDREATYWVFASHWFYSNTLAMLGFKADE